MKPLSLFYILLAYIFLQLSWWGFLLVRLSPHKLSMIVGEFSVFIGLFIFGMSRLRKMLREEEAMHLQQKNFLLSVTHEFKSPLASVKLYLQTILKHDLGKAKEQGFIKNSLNDLDRLDYLVENVLMATQFENKTYTFPKERLDLSELVSSVACHLSENANGKTEICNKISPDIYIMGDRFSLTSAVHNLIENAIKYSPDGAKITIRLTEEARKITFQVADHGAGISEEEKDRIFGKFYRIGDEDTRRSKGTGLGLFIVKQVLDNHNAQILIKPNMPTGSIFEVTF